MKLTKRQSQEILHKLWVLHDTNDLLEEYGISQENAIQLIDSIPQNGGEWTVPNVGRTVLIGEIRDAAEVCRNGLGENARFDGDVGGMLAEFRLAKQLEKIADNI